MEKGGKITYSSLFQLQAGVTFNGAVMTNRKSGPEPTPNCLSDYGNVFTDQASLIIPVGRVHRLDAGAAHGRLYRQGCGGEYARICFDMGVKVAYDFKLYKSVDLD